MAPARKDTAARRALDAASDPRTQLAAGAAVAGAAVAGAAALRHRLSDRGEEDAPPRDYELLEGEPAAAGLVRIALARIAHAEKQLREGLDSNRAAAVHEARKDMKKLRAVLRLLRGGTGDGLYRSENERFRDAGRLLSGPRDAQVRLETLDAVADRGPSDLRAAVAGLRARLGEALAAEELEQRSDRGATAVASALAALDEARSRLRTADVAADGWALLEPGVARIYRQGRGAMRTAAAEPEDEPLHDWRKRAKYRWYHLRILRRAWPEVLDGEIAEAGRLGEALGEDHDLAVLAASAAEADALGGDARDALSRAIRARRAELQERAFDLGRRLYSERPAAHSARMGGYWKAWRG